MEEDHDDEAAVRLIEQVNRYQAGWYGDQDTQAHIGEKTAEESLQVTVKEKANIGGPQVPEADDESKAKGTDQNGKPRLQPGQEKSPPADLLSKSGQEG